MRQYLPRLRYFAGRSDHGPGLGLVTKSSGQAVPISKLSGICAFNNEVNIQSHTKSRYASTFIVFNLILAFSGAIMTSRKLSAILYDTMHRDTFVTRDTRYKAYDDSVLLLWPTNY
jgi:hypothetical protein